MVGFYVITFLRFPPVSPRFSPTNDLSRCKFSTLTFRQPINGWILGDHVLTLSATTLLLIVKKPVSDCVLKEKSERIKATFFYPCHMVDGQNEEGLGAFRFSLKILILFSENPDFVVRQQINIDENRHIVYTI